MKTFQNGKMGSQQGNHYTGRSQWRRGLAQNYTDKIFIPGTVMKNILLAAIILAGISTKTLAQSTTVLPSGFENQAGSAAAAIFSTVPEFQQLFRASATGWQSQIEISALSFRVTDGASSFTASIPSIEIRLSTSHQSPATMSTSYNVNKGADEVVVYLHQNVPLSGRGGSAANPFDLKFQLDQPFIYNPSSGNLLLYITHTGGGGSSVDAESFSDSSTTPAQAFGGGQGGFLVPQPYGIITQFAWTSVPEPQTLLQIAVGGAFFAIVDRRRKTR